MKKTELLKSIEANLSFNFASLILVYGSLRTRLHNHSLLNSTSVLGPLKYDIEKDRQPFLDYINKNSQFITSKMGSYRLGNEYLTDPEYTMYSLGGYPGIMEGGTTPIVYEIYGVPEYENNRIESTIEMLEGWGGEQYNDPTLPNSNMYNKKTIMTPFGEGTIYIYNASQAPRTTIVESGDWVEFLRERAAKRQVVTTSQRKAELKDLKMTL